MTSASGEDDYCLLEPLSKMRHELKFDGDSSVSNMPHAISLLLAVGRGSGIDDIVVSAVTGMLPPRWSLKVHEMETVEELAAVSAAEMDLGIVVPNNIMATDFSQQFDNRIQEVLEALAPLVAAGLPLVTGCGWNNDVWAPRAEAMGAIHLDMPWRRRALKGAIVRCLFAKRT